jgi:hypothetical protein
MGFKLHHRLVWLYRPRFRGTWYFVKSSWPLGNSGTKTHAKGDSKLQSKRMFEEKVHNERAFKT